MIVADIGEKNIEELNLVEPGRDYGWPVREGTFNYISPPKGNRKHVFPLAKGWKSDGFTYPVAQYDRDTGVAIIGGYTYRGKANKELFGQYIFGDIKSGDLYTVPIDTLIQGQQATISKPSLFLDGTPTTMFELAGNSKRTDLRFGYDNQNNIYLLEKRQGKIYKIVAPSASVAQ